MIEDRIREALAERQKKIEQCPVNNPPRPHTKQPATCPRCKATSAGPCWIGVEADAAFVDTVKELVQ